jgi:hypothetical protein
MQKCWIFGEFCLKHRVLAANFDLSAILKHSKIQLGFKVITVDFTLKLNYTKFEGDQRCAFLDIYILVTFFVTYL